LVLFRHADWGSQRGAGGGSSAAEGAGTAIDADDDGDGQGEEQGPDEDVGDELDEEDECGHYGAETCCANRGDEERSDGGVVVVEDAVDFVDESVEEAEDAAEEGGEAYGMSAPEGHEGDLWGATISG
jgi:hypothetical protein